VRWALSDEERAQAAASLERPYRVGEVVAASFAKPKLLPVLVRSALAGAADGVRGAPGLAWVLQARRVRRVVPGAATGAFWVWEAVEDFLEIAAPHLDSSRRALEIGAGAGRVSVRLAPHLGELVVSDVSEVLLDEARKNLAGAANVRLVRTSAFTLAEFADGEFDLVLSHDVFPFFHPNGALALLDEARRVLKPGGACVVSWWTIDRPEWARLHLLRTVRVWARSGHATRSNLYPYTEEFIGALHRAAGLERVEGGYGHRMGPAERQLFVTVGRAPDGGV